MTFAISEEHKVVVVNHPGLEDKLLDISGSFPLPMRDQKTGEPTREFIVIPHNVPNTQGLWALNIKVPSPIGYYYDWPRVNGRFEVAPHQKEIAGFSTVFKRSYDLSEVGTRKTHSHLFASDYMMQEGAIRRVLVITPLSTITRVWADSIFFTFPNRTAAVLHGAAAKRRKLFLEDHDFYIVNHDGIGVITERKYDAKHRLREASLFRDDIDLVIVDEGAEFRNYGTEKNAILRTLIKPEMMVHWLTGTPTPQAPTDAWAQARIVSPDRIPQYWTAFRDRTMKQITQYRWEQRPEATMIVHQVLQPAIRFERSDVIPIEEPVYVERECELTAEQKKHYKQLKNEFVTLFETGQEVTAINQGVLRSKLIQAACGVIYDTNKEPVVLDAAPRHNVVRDEIRQCNEKVIVFVPFRHALEEVAKAVKKEFSCEVVHGGISSSKRDKIFLDFQDKADPRVLVADARCMSHGLTLTAASTILWYAPPPSNNIYIQANGRITRDGQTKTPRIVHISGTPAEQKAYQRVIDNGQMQDLLLDMINAVGNQPLDFTRLANRNAA